MGHKKRNSPARSKATVKSAAAEAAAAASVTVSEVESVITEEPCLALLNPTSAKNGVTSKAEQKSSAVAVKTECERALTTLRRGNHNKALRLMKEMSAKHENSTHSALVHRVQGTVCVKVAAIIDDPNTKQRHLKNAIESARKAVMLSPNSIEFSHFYANLLYETANEGKEYDEAIHECERALAIENPIDPAKESLQDESQQKLTPAEARIAHVQSELRALIQKCNIASISSWMKNFGGNVDDKIRLIPIKRLPEDPMELRFAQARRPNEIKKVTKTNEEKRREVEVWVTAAKLIQNKPETPIPQNDTDKGLDTSSGIGQRLGEKRKSGIVRKSTTSSERKDSVLSFWNSLSLDMKKELLNVRVSDLKAHFSSSKDGLADEVISEALSYAEANNDWKVWSCCQCTVKFADGESLTQHILQKHSATLLPKLESALPKNIESEWVEMLLNCEWKPIDVNAAIKIIKEQSKSQDSVLLEESYSRNDYVDANKCFADSFCNEDEWDSSLRKKDFKDSCNGSTTKDRECGDVSDIVWMECDENQECKSFPPPESWPLSEDTERAKLLERIHTIFKALIKHKYLASSHLNKVLHFAAEELQSLAFGSQLLNYNIDQTPLCICFLGAPELKKILKFVQDLYHSCGLGRYPDKNNALDDLNIGTLGVKPSEKLVLSRDGSYLSLYVDFLAQRHSPSTYEGGPIDDSTHVGLPNVRTENGVLLDSDALLSWIFTGPPSGEQLASWIEMKGDKAKQGTDILRLLEKEFYGLQDLCERKLEHLSFEEALQRVEDLCLEEGKKRENVTQFVRRSYESVLRKRREELIECDDENTKINNRFELDALSNVLKDAESLNANQFGFEETYSGMTSHLCDLESGEDEDWRTKDYLHQVDSCVEVAIQRQKEHVSVELSKIDARIMRTVAEMQQLEFKLETVLAYDYRSILVPLVKAYMRSNLEDLAEKDATEKSDAAREAFLAELARDSKKGPGTGNDHLKNVQEKTKDKKKNRENRRTKDSKGNGSELHKFDCATTQEASFLVPYESEGLDYDITDTVTSDNLGEQELESRRRLELEAEERKLEETLEYQRRIENEAKEKHLAEQHKRTMKRSTEKFEASMLPDDGDGETVLQKNVTPVILGGFPEKTVEVVLPKNGLADEGTLENGFLPSERRAGRRSRRQKVAARSNDGKPQILSSIKENNIEAGPLRSLDKSHDNETKTFSQLQVEEDVDERFKADIEKAVRQSLDSFHAQQKLPPGAKKAKPQEMFPEIGNSVILPDESITIDMDDVDVYGTGLRNEVGEYNCFLNVIIQSLWHLRQFRDEFLSRASSEHVHVGDPCVICALYDIFAALSSASVDSRREAVAPTCLRLALSNHCPNSNFFQEGQMNDASEVLEVIFKCLHQSFNPVSCVSDAESVDGSSMGSWDCTNSTCIAHSLFGMDIFERMNCYNCGLESRHMKYTSFFHNINASALRTMKVMCPESSFDDLLNFVEMNHQLACDTDVGGCGKHNYIHHILSNPPHVFTTVLGWQNTCEDVNDIKATLEALSIEIDVSLLYRGLDPKKRHRLVSVVCYYGQHYHCFAYSYDHERWIMYDDKNVKVIGSWENVLIMCEKGHLQPQVLFFEAVN